MYVCLKIHSYRILTFECIVYNTCAHLCINTMHNYVLAHIFLHIMMVCAHPYFSLEYNTITFHQKRNCSDNRSWPLETGVGPLWSKLQPKVTLQYTMSQGELDLGILREMTGQTLNTTHYAHQNHVSKANDICDIQHTMHIRTMSVRPMTYVAYNTLCTSEPCQ
jgi:hypothetical protein